MDLNAFKPGGKFAPYDELPTWDYVSLAKAFGAQGQRVTTTSELLLLLDKLEGNTSGPLLVEVVIPEHDLPPQLKRLAEPPPALLKYQPRIPQ